MRAVILAHFDFPDAVHLLIERYEPVVAYPSEGTWFDNGAPTNTSAPPRRSGLPED